MSVINVSSDSFETSTIVTTPYRTFTSSSIGVDGSVKVFSRLSSVEKETTSYRRVFDDTNDKPDPVADSNFDTQYQNILTSARNRRSSGGSKDISSVMSQYFDLVKSTPTKPNQVLEITRITPTPKLTRNTLTKNIIKNNLFDFYRHQYSNLDWSYNNYHSLNFFSVGSSSLGPGNSVVYTQLVPTSSVLLFPNISDTSVAAAGRASGSYCLSGSFSFDFHINPRYNRDDIDFGHFKAGTIFHLSSSYALSLVTGSLKDHNGLPVGFRLQLQLSHSADYTPSSVIPGPYPRDLVFLSDDNSLTWNNWHHVVVRWGTNLINNGTGSFVIDGQNKGYFVVPSGSITPKTYTFPRKDPSVLCVGNFYEGYNTGSASQEYFFSANNSLRDGVVALTSEEAPDPDHTYFRHPLKAEIHDLMIRRYYMSNVEVFATSSTGPGSEAIYERDIAFYLPPYFVEDTPIRRDIGDGSGGGVLQTPFYAFNGTTDDPFNVSMAFGVGGHYINLENFVKDFASNRFPRLLHLTASVIDYTTDALEANYFVYNDQKARKRNLTILPCDDGMYSPNYEILRHEKLLNKFVDQYGYFDETKISLDNLVTESARTGRSLSDDENATYEDFQQQIIGPTPENPGYQPGAAVNAYKKYLAGFTAGEGSDWPGDRGVQKGVPLTIYKRLQDPSSDQITIFNISNLYYGNKISPGTFVIRDSSLSGSYGRIGITLRDDGFGGLYRDDSNTPTNKQNTVGNIFYNEGLVLIKNPHLNFFGKDSYEIEFKGIKHVYSTKYEILAPQSLLNSSSNQSYIDNKDTLKASSNPNDKDSFVYISGMYFHDENMNVVAKAKLAQPIIKREPDKILFKVAFDW